MAKHDISDSIIINTAKTLLKNEGITFRGSFHTTHWS
jgi:hypothetical protein